MRIDDLSDIEILNYLAKGIDLYTGEKLGNDHFLRNPTVVSALYEGMMALQKRRKKSSKENKDIAITASLLDSIQRIAPVTSITYLAKNIADATGISGRRIRDAIHAYLLAKEEITEQVDPANNKLKKFATEKGQSKGLVNGFSYSQNGQQYHCLKFSVEAQNYIISSLPIILHDYK